MEGDERVRFCKQCQLNVYNLSEMSRAAAEQLIRNKEDKLCARLYQRADGTMITRDCPVGIRLARRAVLVLVGRAAACLGLIAGALTLLARGPDGGGQMRLAVLQPVSSAARHIQWRLERWRSNNSPAFVLVGQAAPVPTSEFELTVAEYRYYEHAIELRSPAKAGAIQDWEVKIEAWCDPEFFERWGHSIREEAGTSQHTTGEVWITHRSSATSRARD